MTKTIALNDLLRRVEARKKALGLESEADSVEALRNKGGKRTPEKRELLRRAAARAKASGKNSVTSYY